MANLPEFPLPLPLVRPPKRAATPVLQAWVDQLRDHVDTMRGWPDLTPWHTYQSVRKQVNWRIWYANKRKTAGGREEMRKKSQVKI